MSKYTKVVEGGEILPSVKYLNGSPKEYRFDGRNGYFKLGESPIIIMAKNGKQEQLKQFSLSPIAFRVFDENLFGRNKKETWFELFFIDEKNAASCIMFNGSSANCLQNLQKELFYQDLSLLNVKLEISSVEKKNEKGAWQMAVFNYEILPEQEVKDLAELEGLLKIHNNQTITETAVYHVFEGSYYKNYLDLLEQNKKLELAE